MKIVQQTDVLADRYGIEKALDLIADAGFDGYDYSAFHMKDDSSPMNGENYMDLAKKIKAKADERGLKCYQAHAPFPSAKKDDKVFNAGIKEKIIRSMEIAAFLGAEMIVVHPMQHLPYTMNAEKLYELNMAFYRSLIPYAEKFGIKIAVENMFQGDKNRDVCFDGVCADGREFKKYIDDLNSSYITGCLDLGHCGLCGREAQDMLRILGAERITCLHIHDNDYFKDKHTLPCTMSMNWDEICKALAEIGYKGHFTFESDNFLKRYDDEFIPTALRFMYDTAKYLVAKIEKYA
ncbi:MAG: sugar phosphate isomerase/epimerase [Clostridia bacterium]|nr:sugar phosphate isomerase/epimerase [Clostridia bacterium]